MSQKKIMSRSFLNSGTLIVILSCFKRALFSTQTFLLLLLRTILHKFFPLKLHTDIFLLLIYLSYYVFNQLGSDHIRSMYNFFVHCTLLIRICCSSRIFARLLLCGEKEITLYYCPASPGKEKTKCGQIAPRTHSDGPVSQICLHRLLRRELTTRHNPR
jgi:hypothetical protein